MSTELIRKEEDVNRTDLRSIPEACEGMTTAVVTFYVTKKGKLGRMVTLFDVADMPFDHVPMGHARIMNSLGSIKCFKPILYRLDGLGMQKSGTIWKTTIKEP